MMNFEYQGLEEAIRASELEEKKKLSELDELIKAAKVAHSYDEQHETYLPTVRQLEKVVTEKEKNIAQICDDISEAGKEIDSAQRELDEYFSKILLVSDATADSDDIAFSSQISHQIDEHEAKKMELLDRFSHCESQLRHREFGLLFAQEEYDSAKRNLKKELDKEQKLLL